MLQTTMRRLCELAPVSNIPSVISECTDLEVDLLERNAILQSPSRIEELVKIFIHATKVRSQVKYPHSS